MMALSAIMIVLSLLLLGQVTGRFAGQLLAKETQKTKGPSFSEFCDLLAEAYQNIQDRYVEEVDAKEVFKGAVQGMFMALDAHSQYLDADSYSQLERDTEGEFTGIGIHITLKRNEAAGEDELTVVAPMPGSPAQEAGLKAWDRIIEIEGESTRGIKILEAVKKLSGPDGTKVNVTVRRTGEPENLHFTIVRRRIKIESVYSQMLEDGILHVRIERFSENTAADLRKVLQEGKEKNVRGLILDLRNDWGGLLNEAIAVSNLFLDKGDLIVSTKGRLENQNKEYRAENPAFVNWPTLVLVNEISASASEILAGALRDHGRALLVGPKGKRTYGKGSVQTIDPLENSLDRDENGNLRPTALRLTTARYYTPNGTAIDNKDPAKRGLAPDLEVELSLDQESAVYRQGLLGVPNQIEPGEENKAAKKGEKGEKARKPEAKEPAVDIQLQFAVQEMKRMLGQQTTAAKEVAAGKS